MLKRGAKAVQEHVEQRRAEEEATGKKKRGRKPKVVEPLPELPACVILLYRYSQLKWTPSSGQR